MHDLELAEARRRAQYEQRHAALLRTASRSLSIGKARLTKSADTSPILAPIGYSALLSSEDSPEDQPSSLSIIPPSVTGQCYLESAVNFNAGAPFPPTCHHEECHKSFRKALKASRRYSGPALAPVSPLTLDHVPNSPPGPGSASSSRPPSHAGRLVVPQSSPGAANSHPHGYFPYPKPSSAVATDKERDSYFGATDNPISQGPSPSLLQGDSFYAPPIHGTVSQPFERGGLSVSITQAQQQHTPSASPFLRPLQSLGLESPSDSPKMEGQNALHMISEPPIEEDVDIVMEARIRARAYDVQQLGKRRDSNSTITQHDFSRPHLKAVFPQVKSESTPTSPTWRYRPRIGHGSDSNSGGGASPPPLDVGMSALSSPPSPSMRHSAQIRRGFQPNSHNHLAHSVRMAFSMTPIHHLNVKAGQSIQHAVAGSSGYTHVPGSHQHHPHNPLPVHQPQHQHSSLPSVHNGSLLHTSPPPPPPPLPPPSGSAGVYFAYSHPPSRAGSPPIMLPPLSSSTPHSAATTISSRAPSPSAYNIILPPLKVQSHGDGDHRYTPVPTPGASALKTSTDEETTSVIFQQHDRHQDEMIAIGGISSNQSGNIGERIKLPGFSEIIRVTDQ